MSGAITREDVQDEFRILLREAVSQECRMLGDQLQRDVKKELRRFFDEEFWARRSRCSSPVEEREDNRVQTPPTQLCAPLNMPMPPNAPGVLEEDPIMLRHTAHATDELMAFDDFNHAPIAGWANRVNDIDYTSVEEKEYINTGSRESSKARQHSKVYPAPEEANSCASNSDEDSYRKSGARMSNIGSNTEGTRSNRASYCSKYSEQIEVMPGDLPGSRAPDQMFEAWLPEKIRNTIGGRKVSASTSSKRDSENTELEELEESKRWPVGELFTAPSGVYDKKSGQFSCSGCVVAAIKSEYFDYIMGTFLLLNALSIGIQVNYMAGQDSGEVPFEFRIIDWIFCGVFLFELSARIAVYRNMYFYMRGWQWNVFDLVVVVFQVIDELIKLFLEGTAVQETLDSGGGSKVLRIIRLARLVRLLRMVRLIPELKSMVYLISASMWSFFWTAVLLLMLIFCVAVYFTELSTDLVREEKVTDLEEVKKHYGSIGVSILSLFQAITGGDDWRNFVDPFQADGSYFQNAIVFSAYVGFATLVMLNLVTGVFVEGAQRIVQTDKDMELTRHVRKLFHCTDTDLSGEISWEEFEAQLDSAKMENYLKQVEIGTNEAKALFKLLDTDRSGEVSVEEFVQGCLRLRGPARSMDLNALKYDFDEVTAMWGRRFITIDLNIRALKQMLEHMARDSLNLPVEHILV